MGATVDYKIENGFHIFIFSGPLDQASVDKIFRQIEEIAKTRKIILDLSNVNYVNSTFIGYMYHLYETSKDVGYMCFINPHNDIKDTFNLTGVFDIIPYHKDIKAAFQSASKSSLIPKADI